MEKELKNQKCIACEGAVNPLWGDDLQKYLHQVKGWNLADDKKSINKEFELKNFEKALGFVNEVGGIAESEGHHPDIFLHSWNKVKIILTTHAINGLFINDFILASKIDEINN